MKNNKHLDDLFAAARHEESIISEENARKLLAKSEHMQASPFIFSTKGIIMSTIGLSLAAFTAYILLTGSPQTHTTSVTPPVSNLLARSANSNTDEPKKSDAKTTEVKGETLPIPPTPPLPPLPSLPSLPRMISTPIKVTGIKPIPLAPEKYEKMGLTKKDDGTITFSQKNEHGNIFTMGFPKNSWGITIGGKDLENVVSDAPRFAPLIVTDTKGNRRLMQFSSDKDGMKVRSIEINSHGTNKDIQNAVEIANMQIGGEDGDVDILTVGSPDDTSMSNESPKQIHIKTNIQTQFDTTSSGDGIHNNSKRKFMSVTVNTDDHKLDTATNEKPKKMVIMKMDKTISLDSTFNSSEESAAEAMKEAQIQIVGMSKQLKNMNLDSIVRVANQTLKNALEKSSKKQIDNMNRKIKKYNFDSVLQIANERIKEAMKEMEDVDAKLSSLVPILVRTATSEHFNKEEGITYDDGLIFWYNPEKDLLATVPEAQNPVSPTLSTSEIISKSVLYPNPAKSKTTLRFDLSEPRTIALSIHDLLGKRVLDGGSIRETSAGSYEHEFDLSELASGVYLLAITTDKGEQSMQRLVIQK